MEVHLYDQRYNDSGICGEIDSRFHTVLGKFKEKEWFLNKEGRLNLRGGNMMFDITLILTPHEMARLHRRMNEIFGEKSIKRVNSNNTP